MLHTTSLCILEEGLLLIRLFNLEEFSGRLERGRRDKMSTDLFSHSDSIQKSEGRKLEDYFMLTTPKWVI